MSVFSIRSFLVMLALSLTALSTSAVNAEEAAVVAYRLVNARTMHLDAEATARQYEQTFRQLGCEVQVNGHEGHFDLAYRCREWRKTQFADHASAHKWQDWLAALGFDVQHQH